MKYSTSNVNRKFQGRTSTATDTNTPTLKYIPRFPRIDFDLRDLLRERLQSVSLRSLLGVRRKWTVEYAGKQEKNKGKEKLKEKFDDVKCGEFRLEN